MLENLKIGTVVEFKSGRQEIFVGYETPFIYVFYAYSPDMLKTFDINKQIRYLIGFEKQESFILKKQLDANRLKAWYIKASMTNKYLPKLKEHSITPKQVKTFDEIEVFDMFLSDMDVYCYLGKSFSNEIICYHTGQITQKEDLLLNNTTLRSDRLVTIDVNKLSKDYLYKIQHLTDEQIKGMLNLRYGELL